MNKITIILLTGVLFPGITAKGQSSAVPPDMVLVPSGTYTPLYGDTNVVRVESFLLDKYPVTDAEFRVFMDDNKKWIKENAKYY